MKILSLETSTEACSVALNIDGDIYEKFYIAPRQHNQLLLPMIDELLSEHQLKIKDLDAIAYSRGPGSFTGLRVTTSITQALAFSANLPVIAISSLQTLAQGAFRQFHSKHIMTCIDARMHEVYFAQYQYDEDERMMKLSDKELLLKPNNIPLSLTNASLLIGDGWHNYADLFRKYANHIKDFIHPHALDLAYLAERAYKNKDFINAENALPIYLREMEYKKIM